MTKYVITDEDGQFCARIESEAYDPAQVHYVIDVRTFLSYDEEEGGGMESAALMIPREDYETRYERTIQAWMAHQRHIEKQHGSVVVPLDLATAADALLKHFDPDELYGAMVEARLS